MQEDNTNMADINLQGLTFYLLDELPILVPRLLGEVDGSGDVPGDVR